MRRSPRRRTIVVAEIEALCGHRNSDTAEGTRRDRHRHRAAPLRSALQLTENATSDNASGDSHEFSQLLRIANACSYRLCDFVEIFVEPSEVPEIATMYETLQRQRQVAYDMPWSHAVLRAMELPGYRKSAGLSETGWTSSVKATADMRRILLPGRLPEVGGAWAAIVPEMLPSIASCI